MNRHIIGTLYKKEIKDIMRDKKTILMMIVVPIILYPLLFLGSMLLMSRAASSSTIDTFKIAFVGMDEHEELEKFVSDEAKKNGYQLIYKYYDSESVEEAMDTKEADVYIEKTLEDEKPVYTIFYSATDTYSQTASQMMTNILSSYKISISESLFEKDGLDRDYYINPIVIKSKNVATNEQTVGNLFGMIVPFMLISSVLMGAMYPAIDTTAGEKERGTLETLMTLPVKNIELIVSKFLTTATIAVLSAILNVISMAIMGVYFYESIMTTANTSIDFSFSVYIPAILGMLFEITIFALLASAVCLLVCIFAKSFKEAQNYTSPIVIIFMVLSMGSMFPGMKFDSKTALIPVANVSYLMSDLFSFKFDMSLFLTVTISNIAYTIIAIMLMARFFNMESVLFGDSEGSIRILEKRSFMKKGQMPGIGDVVLTLSIVAIVLLYAGSILVLKYGLFGLVIEQLLFVLIVGIYSWYMKADNRKLFSIKMPKIKGLIGSIIMYAGVYLMIIVLTAIITEIFPQISGNEDLALLDIYGDSSVLYIIFASALMPAICEEALFRGFVLGSLKAKCKGTTAIIATGILFGAYHMSLAKMVPVSIFGIFFAYVVYKTGSIFVSVVLHFINNALADLMMLYPDKVLAILPLLGKEKLDIIEMILIFAGGLLLTFIGNLLIKNKKDAC